MLGSPDELGAPDWIFPFKAKMGCDAGARCMQKKAKIYKEEVKFVLKKGTRFQTLIGSYILMALA